jgi:hypothetical protein
MTDASITAPADIAAADRKRGAVSNLTGDYWHAESVTVSPTFLGELRPQRFALKNVLGQAAGKEAARQARGSG